MTTSSARRGSNFRYASSARLVGLARHRFRRTRLSRASHDACEVTGTSSSSSTHDRLVGAHHVQVRPKRRSSDDAAEGDVHQLALFGGYSVICPLGRTTDEMLASASAPDEERLVKTATRRSSSAGGTAKHKASNMLKVHVVGLADLR